MNDKKKKEMHPVVKELLRMKENIIKNIPKLDYIPFWEEWEEMKKKHEEKRCRYPEYVSYKKRVDIIKNIIKKEINLMEEKKSEISSFLNYLDSFSKDFDGEKKKEIHTVVKELIQMELDMIRDISKLKDTHLYKEFKNSMDINVEKN